MFDISPDEPKTVDGFTVSISQNDSLGFDDIAGDQPVDVVSHMSRGNTWLTRAGGADIPHIETMVRIYREEWQEIVEDIVYDCEERKSGIVVFPNWHDHAVTFKTWHNAARGMLDRLGVDLDAMRIVEISPQYCQSSHSFFVMWNQKQFDAYAGCKNAEVSTDYYQSILSGDVWDICVYDTKTDEYVDSCGGFVGEYWSDYIQGEAEQMLSGAIRQRKQERFARLKELIRNRVPLGLRAKELAG